MRINFQIAYSRLIIAPRKVRSVNFDLEFLHRLRGGLIVSCQAEEESPLNHPVILTAFARAAEIGGAVAIRANNPLNIHSISRSVSIPLIGIYKDVSPDSQVYITPTFHHAFEIHQAASSTLAIIAMDCTNRPRPDGSHYPDIISRIHDELGLLVMADISCLEEGIAAARSGADIIATTLSGYTDETRSNIQDHGPDIELVHALSKSLPCPIFCEGRIHSAEEAQKAINAGAWAVVVGKAITSIEWITKSFLTKLQPVIR